MHVLLFGEWATVVAVQLEYRTNQVVDQVTAATAVYVPLLGSSNGDGALKAHEYLYCTALCVSP